MPSANTLRSEAPSKKAIPSSMAQSAHGQHTYYQGGAGDLLCELKVRNDQVYLGGCTNSYSFFPFAFTPPAYFSGLPPDPTVENGPNVWNGFIANVSDLLNFDVGVAQHSMTELGIVSHPSPTDGELTVSIPDQVVFEGGLMLSDATGRTVVRYDQLRRSNGLVRINVASLSPGVYTGVLIGSIPARFNFIKR